MNDKIKIISKEDLEIVKALQSNECIGIVISGGRRVGRKNSIKNIINLAFNTQDVEIVEQKKLSNNDNKCTDIMLVDKIFLTGDFKDFFKQCDMNTYTANDRDELMSIIHKVLKKDKGSFIGYDVELNFPIEVETNVKINHETKASTDTSSEKKR